MLVAEYPRSWNISAAAERMGSRAPFRAGAVSVSLRVHLLLCNASFQHQVEIVKFLTLV
jgi:hypothetical protein